MDNERNRKDPRDNKKPDGDKPKTGLWSALIITLALVLLFSWVLNVIEKSQYVKTTYNEFRADMDSGKLAEVLFTYDGRIVYLTKEEAAKDPAKQKACFTGLPNGDTRALAEELVALGVQVDEEYVEDNSMIMMILYYGIMFSVLFVFMRMLTMRMGGDGLMGGFGKSKA